MIKLYHYEQRYLGRAPDLDELRGAATPETSVCVGEYELDGAMQYFVERSGIKVYYNHVKPVIVPNKYIRVSLYFAELPDGSLIYPVTMPGITDYILS